MANDLTTLVTAGVYPDLGDVTVTYSDSTRQTKNINELGTVLYREDGPAPVLVEVLGSVYDVSLLPAPIQYPDQTSGHVSLVNPDPKTYTIAFGDEVPVILWN